jgi:two-component system copper resistance phosphate regulon response regulator CusR
MDKNYTILLVEDEIKLATIVKEELARVGYNTIMVHNGLEVEKLMQENKFSLVILDISLPGKNGFNVCKEIRITNKTTPIIMLTALGEIQDKVDAFNLGADDYLVKPFHFDELFARIKVLLKRSEETTVNNQDAIIEIEDLKINSKSKTVYRAGQEIQLTSKEFALLSLLAANRGQVISKQEILEKVWDLTFDTGTNTIEVYISFLRNKIDKPFSQKLIFTKSGFGYFIK